MPVFSRSYVLTSGGRLASREKRVAEDEADGTIVLCKQFCGSLSHWACVLGPMFSRSCCVVRSECPKKKQGHNFAPTQIWKRVQGTMFWPCCHPVWCLVAVVQDEWPWAWFDGGTSLWIVHCFDVFWCSAGWGWESQHARAGSQEVRAEPGSSHVGRPRPQLRSAKATSRVTGTASCRFGKPTGWGTWDVKIC